MKYLLLQYIDETAMLKLPREEAGRVHAASASELRGERSGRQDVQQVGEGRKEGCRQADLLRRRPSRRGRSPNHQHAIPRGPRRRSLGAMK